MDKISIRSDEVIASGVKLKDYLTQAIAEVSDDYIDVSRKTEISVDETLKYIQHYRNILLCINEICKARKKY